MTYTTRQLFADTEAAIVEGREEDAVSLLARNPKTDDPKTQGHWTFAAAAYDAGDDEGALLQLRSVEW